MVILNEILEAELENRARFDGAAVPLDVPLKEPAHIEAAKKFIQGRKSVDMQVAELLQACDPPKLSAHGQTRVERFVKLLPRQQLGVLLMLKPKMDKLFKLKELPATSYAEFSDYYSSVTGSRQKYGTLLIEEENRTLVFFPLEGDRSKILAVRAELGLTPNDPCDYLRSKVRPGLRAVAPMCAL